jgi:hypothetical protein
MQRVLPDPVHEAVQDASNALWSIDLRKVRGEQRECLKAAREAVNEAQKALMRG